MKKNVILALVCMMVLASCRFDTVSFGDGRRIAPSSNIVKNEYKFGEFDEIDVNVIANVKYIQGKEGDFRVVLSCPDNYVELFNFEVDGNELDIDFSRRNVNIEANNVDITVYAPTLRRLDNKGVASVEIDRLTTDRLEVENSGVGGTYLSGLKVTELVAECSGVGSMELSGEADRANYECSGVGGIKAEQLKAKKVMADVSGVGGINCYASEDIDGRVSGVGSLKYVGSPQNKTLKRTGIGDITEM